MSRLLFEVAYIGGVISLKSCYLDRYSPGVRERRAIILNETKI